MKEREFAFVVIWYEPVLNRLLNLTVLGVDLLSLGWSNSESGWVIEVCLFGLGFQFMHVDTELLEDDDDGDESGEPV